MENLKITIIQPDIIWENSEVNLEKYSEKLEDINETDVIILPEMFTTGFSMQSEKLKEKMDGPAVKWMQHIASTKDAAVVGSLIIEEEGKIYNRALWVSPERKIETYDKRHLFSMGQEHLHYAAGKNRLIVEYKGWKFCPQICYDLRFPVFSRNLEDYDVVIYMANWPSPRHHVWENLLISRAIENQAYCFGINRVGTDGTGLKYLGDSAFISPKGRADFMGAEEAVKTFEISYTELHEFRKKFPLLNDRDKFTIL
ncbi:amidohydrolase [Draconibacterium halophilum]|uniref:Omega-amidase YafV n=1 Tax=Draconibacterium halophilum TaxID=2706887 RepID=A0A6C0RFA3_9BACT|nr:amidohydrolase [Draconibacterium halophilum]QIA08213.1 amidohydrolase [Draconibacterium halophilum]